MNLPDVDKHTDCNNLIGFFFIYFGFYPTVGYETLGANYKRWSHLINVFSQKIKLVTYLCRSNFSTK